MTRLKRAPLVEEVFCTPFGEVAFIGFVKLRDLVERLRVTDRFEYHRLLQERRHFVDIERLTVEPPKRRGERDADGNRLERFPIRDHEADAAARFSFEHACFWREVNRLELDTGKMKCVHLVRELIGVDVWRAGDLEWRCGSATDADR